MTATIHYLPTANIAPLPRKANVGRLPKGIIRFSTAKREREAAASASLAAAEDRIERMRAIHRRVEEIEGVAPRPWKYTIAELARSSYERLKRSDRERDAEYMRNHPRDPRGAA